MRYAALRAFLVVGLFTTASMAAGEVILVTLGNPDTTPDNGDGTLSNWNQAVGNGTLSTVVSNTGGPLSGVTITTAGFGTDHSRDNSSSTYASNASATAPSWLDLDAIDSTMFRNSSSGSGQIVISGLTGSAYQVDLISARSQSGGAGYITIEGEYSSGGASNAWDAFGLGWKDAGVLTWTSVAPLTSSNSITIDSGSGLVYLTALRLTAIPEPASLALLAVGGCLVVPSRRRVSR